MNDKNNVTNILTITRDKYQWENNIEYMYRYTFNGIDVGETKVDFHTRNIITNLLIEIGQKIKEEHPHSLKDITINLGTMLYKLLFPEMLKRKLDSYEDSYMIIETEEHDIPWELAYNGQHFLCEYFMIGRVLPSIALDINSTIDKKISVLIIAPEEKLSEALKEVEFISEDIEESLSKIKETYDIETQITKLVGESASKERILLETISQEGNISLLHFAGHTDINIKQMESSGLKLSDGVLRNYEIENISPSTVVFVNGCWTGMSQTEKVASSYGVIRGVGKSFAKNGARAVIASLWPIKDDIAKVFACTFYKKALLGYTLGEAIKAGKKNIKERYNDITHFSYVMFGNPEKRLPIYEPEVTDGPYLNELGFKKVFELEKEFFSLELLLVNDLPWVLWSNDDYISWVERTNVPLERKINMRDLLINYRNYFKNLICKGEKDLITVINIHTLKQYIQRCSDKRIEELLKTIDELTSSESFLMIVYEGDELEIEELEVVSNNQHLRSNIMEIVQNNNDLPKQIKDTVYIYNKQTRFETNALSYYLYANFNQNVILEYINKFNNYLRKALDQYNLKLSLDYSDVNKNRNVVNKLTKQLISQWNMK